MFLAGMTAAFGAIVAVFMLTDSPIAAFAALAVGAPIVTAAAWRSLRRHPNVA